MTRTELTEHEREVQLVRAVLSSLRLSRIRDEDVMVAMARLDNWLTENDGRWVK